MVNPASGLLTYAACTLQEKKKQALQVTGVAVGTVAGDVKLYDVKLGELRWRAVNCIEG